MKLDILAIGVHPDDVELSCGGTILSTIAMGKKVGILDLTRGELGTRGNAESRTAEAAEAARILGVSLRSNAEMEDGFFANDAGHQRTLISYIRAHRPEIILCNAEEDRHPDHGRAASLTEEANFLAGLPKILTRGENGRIQEEWRARLVLHYIQDRWIKPDIIMDISPYFETKMKAILAFKSQFYNPDSQEPQTYISSPAFLDYIKSRCQEYGRACGYLYGEGYTCRKMLGVGDIMQLH